jgi:dynein heavy chain 1, cytosolic
MDYTVIRVLEATFALIRKGISNIIDYNESHSDFPQDELTISKYIKNWVLISIMWGLAGSMR